MVFKSRDFKLETERLILRHFKARDAKIMFSDWCSDPKVTQYMLWETNKSVKETKKFVKSVRKSYNTNPYHWIIVNKATKKPIGSIGVGKIYYEEKKCEAGYCLSRKYWNNGIMTEALSAIIKFLLYDQGFDEVTANHHIENVKSGKVMQKCGMKYLNSSTIFNQKINQNIPIHNYSITK